MKIQILHMLTVGLLLNACASATETPPTPTQLVPATPTFIATEMPVPLTQITIPTATRESFTPVPALTSTSIPDISNICADPQVTPLIDSLKNAVLNSDGTVLETLVSPASGMDVRWVRYGTVVNYQASQAKFLFETTYEVDWGAEPGSGAAKVGSFHDVIVPDLLEVFNLPYILHCNELKHGGASYELNWPYDKDFYSIYFPGTTANGNLDWHTWVAGIEYAGGKPYLYALTQFFWEP